MFSGPHVGQLCPLERVATYNWRTALELPVAPDVRMGAATLQIHGFLKCGRNLLAELPSDPAFEPNERDLEQKIPGKTGNISQGKTWIQEFQWENSSRVTCGQVVELRRVPKYIGVHDISIKPHRPQE